MAWHTQRALLTAAIITITAACSGATEQTATPTSETSTTTESTTTTTAPTTTTTEPTTTTTTVEDAVREAHTRYMTELNSFDSRIDGYESYLIEAREVITGPLLRRVEENYAARAAANEFVVGSGYESNIVSVEIDGDRATVLDCSKDTGRLYDGDGNLLASSSDTFNFRRTLLVMIDDKWLVEELYSPSEETCDPEDYQ
jgi:DNA-binding protein Fis